MATANTKTVSIYLADAPQIITWSAVPAAQVLDVLNRWNAVHNGGQPDVLVFTQSGYEFHLDMAKISGLVVTA